MLRSALKCLCLIALFITFSKSATINMAGNQGGFMYPDEFESRYGNKNDDSKSGLSSITTAVPKTTPELPNRFLVYVPSNEQSCQNGYIYVEGTGCRKKTKIF